MNNRFIKISALAISLLYVDLFCGAGGTSSGVELAQVHGEKCAKVIACVNHDKNAIASHSANHPDSLHFTEDIRTLELSPLAEYATKMRKEYPFAKLVLWASLECTNHSKAKGGMSRDADSRTLADHLFRYIEALDPDSVQIENVEEFLIWGPLEPKVVVKGENSYCPLTINKEVSYELKPRFVKDGTPANKYIPKVINKNGTSYCPLRRAKIVKKTLAPTWVPVKERKGEFYNEWVDKVKKCGFNYGYRLLNAADYGSFTSRKRYFAQFNKPNMAIIWPDPTHAKNPSADLFGKKEKWKAVKEVLDLEDEGVSIFDRKKDLVEATLDRIYHGLIKFVAGGKDQWLLKYNSKSKSGKHVPPSIEDPAPTVPCQGRLGIMNAKKFLTAYYGNGFASSLESPSPTVTTGDRFNIINTTFIDQQFGNSKPTSVDSVLGGLTANPKYNPVTVNHWVMNTNFKNIGSSIDSPAPTLTANRKWHYLMDAQYSRIGNSLDQPCFTLIARMDKTPPYLVDITQDASDLPDFIKVVDNVVVYEIYDNDSPMMKKIKEFMAHYGLKDIKMRMLKIQELKEIMGFPEDYKLIGTQAEQKKYIGNAVEVTMAKVLCEAMAFRLHNNRIAA
ncbi:DNA methyltransferase [Elizabethkingia miricola]|uniref:DNA cytosine methyltransferase n=1 Tax=Elizabethkingia miricola TaxID=172045 RepID=UPI0009990D30|nr:DNA cytosine methyltransferase [Elizabethkingia miricola]OPC76196.1 DNA methyltransferase [Elizabethkingia miricola]